MQIDVHSRDVFFAKICLLRSVVPDGNLILYRPSCSGRTRRAGFAGATSDVILVVRIGLAVRIMDGVDTSGLTDNVATDCFSAASTFSRAFCSLTFLACLA